MDNIAFFHGHKSPGEVAEILAQACFLVIFSNYETQSCAILEAFSCGVPVIATRVGGIPEIVNTKRGVLIEKGDEQKLTEEMDKMLNTPKHFDPAETRKYAVENFSFSVVGKQFLDIYTGIIE